MSKITQAKKALRWHVVGRMTRQSYAAFRTEQQAQREATRMEKEEHVPKGTYIVIERIF